MSNDLKFVVVGYNTRQHRNVELAYMRETATQALQIAAELHPDVDVYYVKRVDD